MTYLNQEIKGRNNPCTYDLILKTNKQDEGKKLCWELEVIKFVNDDAMLFTTQKDRLTRPSPESFLGKRCYNIQVP